MVLLLTSFVLAWGEAWYLDGRVIPQERYAQNHYRRIMQQVDERTSLMRPASTSGNTESIANFYSPYASLRGSDDGEDMVRAR